MHYYTWLQTTKQLLEPINFLIIILCFALSFLSSYIVVRGVYLDPRDSSSVEKFHMKFIKEILGVHCKASNVACRAELVRLPLWVRISFSSIKFWEHLLTSENTLVFKNFQATKNFNPCAKELLHL
jgi:hypothetical protein